LPSWFHQGSAQVLVVLTDARRKTASYKTTVAVPAWRRPGRQRTRKVQRRGLRRSGSGRIVWAVLNYRVAVAAITLLVAMVGVAAVDAARRRC